MAALDHAIGVGLPGAKPRGFDPRLLFADGGAGAWFDPGQAASVFADEAGTVAAGVNTAVARLRDRSGGGHDLVQPNAAARPVLRRDEGGRAYLQFDGVDDFLVVNAPALRITGALTLAAAIRREAAGRYDLWMCAQTNAATVNPYELRTSPGGSLEFTAADAARFEADEAGPTHALPVGAARVVTAVRAGGTIAFGVDAGAATATHTLVPTADAGTDFRLGMRKGSPLFAAGRMYGALVAARALSAAELAGLRGYLGAAAGAVF